MSPLAHRLRLLPLGALILLGLPAAAQIAGPPAPVYPYSPLQNGGFELPNLAAGTFQYAPTGGAFTFVGSAGVAANGSPFGNPTAPEGDQVGLVQGGGSMSQSFALAAGRYRISFKAAQRNYLGINTQSLQLKIDGQVLATIAPVGTSFAPYSTQSFVIGLGYHSLQIIGLNPNGGDNTAFLDDLKIESIAAIAKSWNDPTAWQSGAVPTAGTDGTIAGTTVVRLDQTAAAVRNLTVLGELICADANLNLSAEQIMVHGRFECGSEFSPYQQKFVLTLTGPITGKSIEVMAPGALELHGAPRVAWTQLRATAAAGATLLQLATPVDWQNLDQIVVAPSSYLTQANGSLIHQDEVATIQAVQNGGLDLLLQGSGLATAHYGQSSSYATASGNFTLDERSEVGLLTRNIRIEGDAASSGSLKGGHLMVMAGAVAHVEGVELLRMGRVGELGRYPFHWHLVGDAPGQYIKNSSIHQSFNRCVTVHGTNKTLVADNVCHDFIGHGYFLENGTERLNTFTHNLGIRAKKPAPGQSVPDPFLEDTDSRTAPASNGPAVFWISNAENSFSQNAAAGSEGTGFWYRIDQEYAPAFGSFTNNRAHSSTQGFSSCRNDGGTQGMTVPGLALIENLTVYQTGQGVWPCSSEMNRETHLFRGLVVASAANGMQAPNPMIFESSAFIAYSANMPVQVSPTSDVNWRAIQVYDQGFLLDRVAFVNYDQPAMSVFYPGSGAHKLAKNRVTGLSLVNSPNVFPDPDNFSKIGAGPALWGDVIHDLDGSLVGAGLALVNDHPIMYDGDCLKPLVNASGGPMRVAGYACPLRFGHFRSEHAYDYTQPGPYPFISPITVLRSDGYRNSSQHIERRFITEFALNDLYQYSWRYDQGAIHNNIQIELRDVDPGSEAIFEILDVPPTVTVSGNSGPTWVPAIDLADLQAGASHRYYWRDYSLFVKLAGTGQPWHAMDTVKLCLTGTNCCPNYWACNIATDTLNLGTLPKLDITSPADGARVPSGSTVTVSAAPAAGSAAITAGYLYIGNDFVAADRIPPYTFTLPPLPDGAYTLKLRAAAAGGKSFTTLQQIFIGEPGPRVEMISPTQNSSWLGSQPVKVSFNLYNWPLTGGNHLVLLDNDVDLGLGPITSSAPIYLTGLAQGKHELELAIATASGKVTARSDRKVIYVMNTSGTHLVVADFEDGLDERTTLVGDANLPDVSEIRWAWGNALASPFDGSDDINYFDINPNGGANGIATYRLKLEPAADWQSFNFLLIKAATLPFDVIVEHANGTRTPIGSSPVINPYPNPMSFNLPANPALKDQVVAIELQFLEQNLPLPPLIPRLHLFQIKVAP